MIRRIKSGIRTLSILAALVLVGGCYTTPVRHLAADVAILKKGVSTQEDVLVYLGDPDEVAELGGGVEKWYYKETDTSFLEGMPFIGKRIGSPEYIEVVVTLEDGIVADADYSSTDEDDLDWADDFSWQKK